MTKQVVQALAQWRVWHDDSGQDLLEYALLVALIAMVALGAVQTVGATINGVFWTYIDGVVSGI
jgi:Flp pilus assembly pilin Flp